MAEQQLPPEPYCVCPGGRLEARGEWYWCTNCQRPIHPDNYEAKHGEAEWYDDCTDPFA